MRSSRRASRSRGAPAFLAGLFLSLCVAASALAIGPGGIAQLSSQPCVATAGPPSCDAAKALTSVRSIAISPDGAFAYTASPLGDVDPLTGKVAAFRREADGSLTQVGGGDACITHTPDAEGCSDVHALGDVSDLVVSPDGFHLYTTATSNTAGGVAVFNIGHAGQLTQAADPNDCISDTGSSGECIDGTLNNGNAIDVSPDGKSIYVVANNSIAIIDIGIMDSLGQAPAGSPVDNPACISDAGGSCVDGFALQGTSGLTVSPDGKSVYVVANGSDALTSFGRDSDGDLTLKTCIEETDTPAPCADGRGLANPEDVAVSPDGRFIYTVGEGGLAVFKRDPDTGNPMQLTGTAGCISSTGNGGECAVGKALSDAAGVVISPDGKQIYVASRLSDAVAVFDRNFATGEVTQKADPEGCISNTGANGCTGGVALNRAGGVALSPDGAFLYSAAEFDASIATFSRGIPVTLTVSRFGNGPGRVDSSPAGIDCGNTGCVSDFAKGTQVTLTATPLQDGYTPRFLGAGCPEAANTTTCTITLEADTDVQVFFDPPPGSNPPPPGGGDSDTTAPKLTLKFKDEAKLKKFVKVKATVDEAAKVEATAKVKHQSFAPKPTSLQLGTGARGKLKLKFSRKTLKAAQRALKESGKPLKTKVTVTATDAAGNAAKEKAKIKLTEG